MSSQLTAFTNALMQVIKAELIHLTTFNPHTRPWHMPMVAAIAVSLPVFLGAYMGQLGFGLIASLGSMVILNLPYAGNFLFRMTQVLACSFGFVACFTIGLLAQWLPSLTVIWLGFVTFWVAIFSRYYRLAPPAGVFMLMATAIALFMPTPLSQIPFFVGLIAIGCLFSGMVGCVYSLLLIVKQPVLPPPERDYIPDMLVDSLLVAIIVALSQAIALVFEMPRAYWVSVSCYVVISGISFRSMWVKQVHRIVGTAIGMLVAWGLLMLGLSPWGVGLTVFALIFLIETLVVRHYGMAVIFITPLTIILAEYSGGGVSHGLEPHQLVPHIGYQAVILARFWDTVLGCVIGIMGGVVMHARPVRPYMQRIEQWLLKVMPLHKLPVVEPK